MRKARPDAEGRPHTQDFVLRNDPPKPKRPSFENFDGTQKVLFAGMNALPGQLDLFETDGQPPEE